MKITRVGIFLFCLAIGFGLVMQSRVTDGQRLYVSAGAVEEYRTNTEAERQETERLRELAAETEEKIKLYYSEKAEENTSELEETLQSELLKYKMFSGAQAVHGPGIKVIINDGNRPLYDGENINDILVHDADIVMVVNELRRAGAEAIAVNGQRIVNTTEIVCAGYTIRINGITYARPFVITAIGDATRMSSVLLSDVGYGTSLKDWGVLVETEVLDDLTIDGYTGVFANKYMKEAKGDE